MDSTLGSDRSVGLPLGLVVYDADRLASDRIVCIEENNPYMRMLRTGWGERLRQVFDSLEDPVWDGAHTQVPLLVPSAISHPLKKITTPDEKLI